MSLTNEIQEIIFGKKDQEIVERTTAEVVDIAYHEIGHFLLRKLFNINDGEIIAMTVIPIKEERNGKKGIRYGANIIIKGKNTENLEKTEQEYRDLIAYYLAGIVATRINGNYSLFGIEDDLVKIINLLDEVIEKYYKKNITDEEKINIMETVIVEEYSRAKEAILAQEEKLKILVSALVKRKILLGTEVEKLYNGTIKLEDLELIEDL